MKPPPFAYHAPRVLDEAYALLADGVRTDENVRVLAGGQSLVPMMNFRLAAPDALVDIGRISSLRGLRVNAAGELEVGAGVRQRELLMDPAVARHWMVLAEGTRHIGHPQIRARGTVCGSIAHHDPVAELPALAVALRAQIHVGGVSGERVVAADEFFLSHYEVALHPAEMVVRVTFPPIDVGAGWGFREVALRRGDFALVGAVCVLSPHGSVGDRSRVVVFGAGPRPMRARAAEVHLSEAAGASDIDVERLRRDVAEALEPASDVHASAEYRRLVGAELAVQCVVEANGRRS